MFPMFLSLFLVIFCILPICVAINVWTEFCSFFFSFFGGLRYLRLLIRRYYLSWTYWKSKNRKIKKLRTWKVKSNRIFVIENLTRLLVCNSVPELCVSNWFRVWKCHHSGRVWCSKGNYTIHQRCTRLPDLGYFDHSTGHCCTQWFHFELWILKQFSP